MTDDKQDELNLGAVERLLGYFDPQVLAAYRNEPHKNTIKSDYFSGELEITSECYRELEGRTTRQKRGHQIWISDTQGR